MFSLLRNRFGIPGVIAVTALIFAMAGGALAAKKYVITSTNQIKPSVLKQLRGKAGPAGPAGPAGAAGIKGDAGAKGDPGAKGDTGAVGPKGATGATGAVGPTGPTGSGSGSGVTGPTGATGSTGASGPEGPPGPFVDTLPSEKTETGNWAAPMVFLPAPAEAFTVQLVPFSFSPPLSEPLENPGDITFVPKGAETGEGVCPGTADEPEAAPGNLCIYTEIEEGEEILYQGSDSFSPTGVVAAFKVSLPGRLYGSWAVTAP